MEFDERQLRAFMAVAKTGTLGRAAKIANLTQPSLSRLIQGMELRLDHRLFDRGTKGMALTVAGELLRAHTSLLLFEMDAARAELDALRGLRRGTVRIGGVAAVMRTLVARSIGTLLAEAPMLSVETHETVDSELPGALLQRHIDLAVSADPLDDPEVQSIGICDYQDRFAAFCAVDNPLPDRPDLERLAREGWVMPPRGATPRQIFEDILRSHGLGPAHVPVESTSVEMMIAVAGASDLLCWLPEPLVAAHLGDGFLRKLDAPALVRQRSFHLYRRRSGSLPEAARRFLDHFPMA